ncbi:hypothetical protein GGQ89_000902 [Sphingomonas yabuuchiae]|uniref:Uncharacterized protein n=1 Tax=Sphingomonas yabuuchiae TaxID=172044 RepID=A0ABR6K6J2_9SPHN|nr:hypothetical protein [Sphingomonas yabuuchiae]
MGSRLYESKTADGSPRRPLRSNQSGSYYDARLASSLLMPSAASVPIAPDSR